MLLPLPLPLPLTLPLPPPLVLTWTLTWTLTLPVRSCDRGPSPISQSLRVDSTTLHALHKPEK